MPRINLLPWREEERKRRQRDFGLAMGGAVLAAIAVVVSSGAATIEFRQSVVRSGIELASGQVRVALTDGASGKPKRMPKGLRELLTQST